MSCHFIITYCLFQIDNVQSLLQCPSVLVCVGREPSHPSIIENFRKTSDDRLPKLSPRSRSSDRNEGREGKGNADLISELCFEVLLLDTFKALLERQEMCNVQKVLESNSLSFFSFFGNFFGWKRIITKEKRHLSSTGT